MIRRLSRFLALRATDKLLLVQCLASLAAFRIGLCFLPYQTLRKWMPEKPATDRGSVEDLSRTAWGIRHAARLVPGASCLTQALAAQLLLARAGHQSQIEVGVAMGEDGRFAAHAWLISDGHVIVGGSPQYLERFTPLANLDSRSL